MKRNPTYLTLATEPPTYQLTNASHSSISIDGQEMRPGETARFQSGDDGFWKKSAERLAVQR